MSVIVELKAEYGFASADDGIHLWHLVRGSSRVALCDRTMPAAGRTRSAATLGDVFPERLCRDCPRRYGELVPTMTGAAPALPGPV